jgi:2,4-dienoyl-CoA reductase-like NADH-dependent reductase (Old Yellow Enzyme family)
MATSKLFEPIQLGTVTLQHRVVMAPLTRYRGNTKHTPTDPVVEHYAARASLPGTLIISEAFIAHKASGDAFNVPGIWSASACPHGLLFSVCVFLFFPKKKKTHADVLLVNSSPHRDSNPGNNPVSVFSHLVEELRRRHPNFGYLHVIESRVQGIFDRDDRAVEQESNDFLRVIWAGKPWISAGGFSRDNAIKQADEKRELVAFGRYFTSNVSLNSYHPPSA